MTTNSYFRRVPLWVKTVPFDDVLLPRSVVFQNKEYPVTRVISFGELPHPASRLPVMKFIAEIEGREKVLVEQGCGDGVFIDCLHCVTEYPRVSGLH